MAPEYLAPGVYVEETSFTAPSKSDSALDDERGVVPGDAAPANAEVDATTAASGAHMARQPRPERDTHEGEPGPTNFKVEIEGVTQGLTDEDVAFGTGRAVAPATSEQPAVAEGLSATRSDADDNLIEAELRPGLEGVPVEVEPSEFNGGHIEEAVQELNYQKIEWTAVDHSPPPEDLDAFED